MQRRRKKEPAAAITRRVRNFRARQRFRKLLYAHDGFIALDLAAHYRNQKLSADCWISARVFFQNYQPEHQQLLMSRELSGVERTTAVIDDRRVLLIRPKGLTA